MIASDNLSVVGQSIIATSDKLMVMVSGETMIASNWLLGMAGGYKSSCNRRKAGYLSLLEQVTGCVE